MFNRKGRVIKSGSPVLKSNNMVMVKPTGSRRKTDFPALDIRENQRNASPNPFNDDDEINLQGVKRNAWYARRYCAMSMAVEHTRQGKYSSEEYALEAVKRLKRKDSQRPKSVSQQHTAH